MQFLHDRPHFVIVCEPGKGIAEMLTGYLHYYAGSSAPVSWYPAQSTIPTLVEQVLHEDGIHNWHPFNDENSGEPVVICINRVELPVTVKTILQRYKSEQITLDLSTETSINIHQLRALREEIRQCAIMIMGKFSTTVMQ